MATTLPKDHCADIVRDLVRQEGWLLPAEAQTHFVDAIFPLIESTPECIDDDLCIRKIAHNYYLDGPMVQEMLREGSIDGEQLWQEWREYFIRWGQLKGLSAEESDEFVQNAYFQMQRALRNFKFGSRLTTYFHAVCNNLYKDWLRRKQQAGILDSRYRYTRIY